MVLNREVLNCLGHVDLPDWAESMAETLRREGHASLLTAPVLQGETTAHHPGWQYVAEPQFAQSTRVGWHFGGHDKAPAWLPPWVITADSELAGQRWLHDGNTQTGVRAAIGGTFPLIDLCREDLLLSKPRRLLALTDGVATFVCSTLEQARMNLGEALREAQWQGVAPANPGRHLHSLVARDRLALLASCVFGVRFDVADIPVEGFGRLERIDVVIAGRLGFALRQLGIAERHADGRFELWVQPRLIPSRYLLSQVRGGMEAAYLQLVDGTPVFFTGAGTGKNLILRGLLRDTLAYQDTRDRPTAGLPKVALIPATDLTEAFYLRLGIMSFARTLAGVTTIFADHGIGLRTVLPAAQLGLGEEATGDEASDLILLTERVNEGAMMAAIEQIKNEVKLAGLRCLLRVEGDALPTWA